MGLRRPGGRVTQHFGPSRLAVEPYAWVNGAGEDPYRRAYWQAYPGGKYSKDVHVGVDFGGMGIGAELKAAEAGTVTRSDYDKYNGGGHVVEVEIRPDVRYSYNHCDSRLVKLGQKVKRGQPIAILGCTGTIWTGTTYIPSCIAAHVHVNLTMRERLSDGIRRTMLYDFEDFMIGGYRENDPRIKPL